jgi:hypothetical protein
MILDWFRKAWQEGTELITDKSILEPSVNPEQKSHVNEDHLSPMDANLDLIQWRMDTPSAAEPAHFMDEGDASHQLKPQETRRTVTEPEGITWWFE